MAESSLDFDAYWKAWLASRLAEIREKSEKTGNAWFYSTSRGKLWMKGEESGNVQPVHEILADCDSDALLYIVDSDRPMCHTGERTCFHNIVK